MAQLAPMMQLRARFEDKCGHPLAGGSVFAFEVGTSTPKDTFKDADGTIPNTHPIKLDYRGEADIYLLSGRYRFVVYSCVGVKIYDVDNVGEWLGPINAENVFDGNKNQHQINEEQAEKNIALSQEITDSVKNEHDRALLAETNLQTSISNESTRATDAEASLNLKIDSETQRAQTAEQSLQLQITTGNSGIKYFSTEAEVLTFTPGAEDPKQAYAFDTKKNYLWNGTAWIDEGLSQLARAQDYTDLSIKDVKKILYEPIVQQVIGAATINSNANYETTPVTVAFANPVLGSGMITKVSVAVNSPTSAIKVRVFKKTGSTLSVIKEQVLSVNSGTIEYPLISPIDVQAGQFLGWYAVGGTIKSIRDGGVYPATYPANNDVASIDASVSYTAISWQIKFTVDQAGVYPLIGEMEEDIGENKTNLEALEALTVTGGIVNYGRPENVVIGSITASKKYIPFVRQIEVGGKLIKAKFSLKTADSVGFFVARMIATNTLQITQETDLVSFGAGINEFTLSPALMVESGDFIGWKTSNNQVSFVSATADDLGYFSGTHDASLNRLIIDGTYTSSQPQMQMTVSTKRAKGVSAMQLTQAEYDALPIKDSNTLYIVSD